MAIDPAGTRLYIADVAAHRVRVVDLVSCTISTFSGTGQARHDGDGGPAKEASIFGARAVEVAKDGAVYVLERQGNTLRRVDPGSERIATVAGTGAKGATGDGGPALLATFNGPKEFAIDPNGHLFIVDTENNRIRRIDAATQIITTVAGTRILARPHGVAVAPDDSIIIADTENHRIWKVSP